MAPPSGTASRPGRALATLVAVIVALFLAILGGNIGSPGKWHNSFKVNLGLDLTSGTTVALKAVPEPGHPLNQGAMTLAKSIMFNRVNGAGFTGAQVVQQGNNIINVSAPGKKSAEIVDLASKSAILYFRQVLLLAQNTAPAATPTPTPTPSASGTASPSPSPSGSASPSVSPSGSASPSVSPSSSAKAAGLPGAAGRQAHEMATRARSLAAAPAAQAKPKASGSASPSPSPSASGSPSPTPSPTPSAAKPAANGTTSWQQAEQAGGGGTVAISPKVLALFNKLNCAKPNWKQQIGYNHLQYDDPTSQIVACGNISNTPGQNVPGKFVLDKSTVYGTMIKPGSAQAQPASTSTSWQVNFSFNGEGASKFGTLTTMMNAKYGSTGTASSPLDYLGIVLDGNVVSFPAIDQGAITGGSSQITGSFTQDQATSLANVLAYGSLPLTFVQESQETVTPQLGHEQLDAGLIAAGLGLLIVVFYLLFYYRGLAIISASSLIIAAALAYESVIVLGKYQHLSLSLAGIAGLIVAIGITADSFVVFFERLRDEVREGGRSLRTAVEHGWTRARRTILVSDTVSFLAAALLYYFAIGDVRGFAFTLGLTTVIDIVVVFTFTKPMMTLFARTKFFGGGHRFSGLDPTRLGARAPWRGGPRRARAATARASRPSQTKEA